MKRCIVISMVLLASAAAHAQPAEPMGADDPAKSPQGTEEPVVTGESGFMDVRLNFTFVNENIFAEPGETIPSVPGWRFGRPNSLGVLFFDNYDTRFSGYETLAHAVMYRRYNADNYEVEGALVLRINDLSERTIDLSDAGSYIRVAYWFDPSRRSPARVDFVAFPTSSDRMRLGYSYRLSWGGSDEYRRSRSAVPGFKLQYEVDRAYAYVGAKSAVQLDSATSEQEAVLGFLGGAGVDVTELLHLDINGGYFNRGSNELQDVVDEDVQLFGVSGQVALHDGMPIGSSIDYLLYRNDPTRVDRLFQPPVYPGGISWLVAAEATVLGQTLKDPEATGSTTVQWASAGDVNARLKWNRTRFRLDLQYRDLAYILHSTPSLPTYTDFPREYDQGPNLFAAAGVDQNWADTFTLGVVLGVEMPATLETPTGALSFDTVEGKGRSTAVIRSEGDLVILPEGEKAVPLFASKLTGRLDFAEFFAAILEIYYTRDANQTRLTREGPEELLRREFGEFNQLGFNATLQARF